MDQDLSVLSLLNTRAYDDVPILLLFANDIFVTSWEWILLESVELLTST